MERPEVKLMEIPDPYWLVGFVEGEGCFFILITKSEASKSGIRVQLKFSITQHSRDLELIKSLAAAAKYLGCGNPYLISTRSTVEYRVNKFSDIDEKILPFFYKYPLRGQKYKDYSDFHRVADIIKVKGHLTAEGFEQIRKIKLGMNTGRAFTEDKIY